MSSLKAGGGVSDYKNIPRQAHFEPYSDNGGSIVAVAGDDFAIIAADSRLTVGYSIYTRKQSKLFRLSNKTVLASTGCWCDTLTLTNLLEARFQMYLHEHNKQMETPAIAQLLSTVMYYKRFFPYYVSNVLAGVDAEGKGCVYAYDPIGHMEKHPYRAGGSSAAFLQPLLDNQLEFKNMDKADKIPLTLERALALMKDIFISAAERNIYTGDGVNFNIITKDGVQEEFFILRKD
uniref:Proteasome subunit beta n=2 Tax=Clastoptera arizonana TaxID=38151 RepID=A0A1B6C5V8_9HEMI